MSAQPTSTAPTRSWKQTYQVEPIDPRTVVRHDSDGAQQRPIVTDSYYVDLVARRDAFIERERAQPPLLRTGRRWQPPPERIMPLPSPRSAARPYDQPDVAPNMWTPVVISPPFKYEQKRYSPERTPPLPTNEPVHVGQMHRQQHRYDALISPMPGSLDDAARRQMRGVQPPMQRQLVQYENTPSNIQVQMRIVPTQLSPQQTQPPIGYPSEYGYRIPVTRHEPAPRIPEYRAPPESRYTRDDDDYQPPPHQSTITGRDVPAQTDAVQRRVATLEGRSATPQPARVQPPVGGGKTGDRVGMSAAAWLYHRIDSSTLGGHECITGHDYRQLHFAGIASKTATSATTTTTQ
jgi:hypothetical protein